MDIRYAIKRNKLWLQGVEPSPTYCRAATAPTMGNRHTYSEYRTVWGNEPKYFEHLTLVSNIRVIMEEYRWGDKKPSEFKVMYCYADGLHSKQ